MRKEYEGFPDDKAFHEMMHLFHEMTFIERMQKMVAGFKEPRDSGAYKFAKLQLARLTAPAAAIAVPICMLLFLVVFVSFAGDNERAVKAEVIDPEAPPDLEEIEEVLEEPPEMEEPVEVEFQTDINVDAPQPVDDQPMSPNPVEFDAVAIVKSPVTMTGIYGSRNPGQRGKALGRYNGTTAGEMAVMRALRWLKKNQQPDGSWQKNRTAMTGLALLTFLAHGETTDEVQCPEFAGTVRKAIDWLVSNQLSSGLFKVKDGHNYSHPIAAYALCEAYALTQVPKVRDAAERAIVHIIKGQNLSGGWDYNMKQSNRDDTSYMGWCAQAIKAAKMAGLEVEGLEEAFKKAPDGFKKNSRSSGGFGYTGPQASGLTGVGVLCMQLMHAGDEPEAKAGLMFLQEAQFSWENWDKQPYKGRSPIYYWYYITQAKFHAGGNTWDNWNKQFNPELVKQQERIKGEYVDHTGKPREIGYWESPSESEHGDGLVMDTCLCALQLEVYYRYLPTFQTPQVVKEEDFSEIDDSDEIDIDIDI